MKNLTFLLLFLVSAHVSAQESSWLRHSAISPDGSQIAFTYKGDIYLVSSLGGQSQPITFHEAHDYQPVWSNDGKSIAFASNRFGNFDIYMVSIKGGDPKRLTFHSTNELPYTFSNDDSEIIFGAQRLDDVAHRQFPTGSQPEIYKVSVNGGRVNQVWTIPAEKLKISKDGSRIVYHDKKGGENEFRKHHTSSITRDLWLYDTKANTHRMLTKRAGEDRNPVFSTDETKLYYLSEASGSFNVHSLDINNPQVSEQVTQFQTHPVRYLSMSDKGKLCFTYNGQLFTLDNGAQPVEVKVEFNTGSKTNSSKRISINGNVAEMDISPDGKEVVYIVRGEVFVSSVEGKFTKRVTNTPDPERFVSFTPDGKGILYASERNGIWNIFKSTKTNPNEPYFYASTLLKEEPVIQNDLGNYQPKISPDGNKIAYIENRTTLRIFDINSKETRTLLTANELYYMGDGDQYFEWSPDGKWLLVEYSPQLANTEVVLISTDGSRPMVNLTESGYGDYRPAWVNKGQQMLWLSTRHGMRSYANSGRREMDVYSMFFTKDGWDQFNLSKDEYALLKEIEENKKKESAKETDSKKKKKKKDSGINSDEDSLEVKIDWDGLKDRKKRLTIHSSRISDAVLSSDGELIYYLTRFEKGLNLWSTNLRTKETKMAIKLNANRGSLMWDNEMKNLFLLADGRISKLDVKGGKKTSVSIGSEMEIDLLAERYVMFDHVWNRANDMFYISDYHGVDWDMLGKNYRPKVASVGNDFELTELLSEMLGELNVSHSGARYRPSLNKPDATASLGVFMDYNHTGNGIKITEVIRNGPLDKDNLDVKTGMIIEKIDGVTITPALDYPVLLNRKAGKFTALEIYNPTANSRETITVKPISLGAERGLLYSRWVKTNEDEVARQSNGKVGYIHIPGMGDGQYRDLYEKVMGRYHDTDALIVDTRFNGGGDLVSDLAMFFTGKKFISYSIESRDIGYEPGWRWTKPSLALVNEAQYSDGHCFACGYKDLKIGKLVGMPVPGTCSFAGWEMLQNGSIVWGAVPLSAKDINGNWMENNQTSPDIEIKNVPGSIDKGIDLQLERAVEIMMEEK